MVPESDATILVVDDITANRALLVAALDDAGYRVIEAASGAEALACFAREVPACVLLDVRMPGMDGFEVCEKMRALPGGATVPVIFVTALRDLDTFDHALTAGGFDFLTKPVRPNELVGRVRTALALSRASSERDELSTLVRQQREDLMRAVLLNERLAAFLVHDLKNPVAGMQLGADLIAKDETASPRTRELAGRIKTQAAELLRMLLGLLDLSKGEEGRLVLARTSVELATLASEVLAEHAARAESRSIRLVQAGAGVARVDLSLTRRVLANLVDNALRHAPKGSAITVTVTREAHGVWLSVADQGTGVPPALRERIFDRFVQAETNAATRAGRGLGLAFCKLVVEAHGGTIAVADGSPGAVFRTWWPDVD